MPRSLVLATLVAALSASCNDASHRCDLFESVTCLDSARIKADVDYLASPALQGRRAGWEGNALAATRIEAALEGAGLAHAAGLMGYRQELGLRYWELTTPPELSLGGVARALGPDYEVFEFSGNGQASGTLFYAGYGLTLPSYDGAQYPDCPLPSGWDDFGGVSLAGRIVVITLDYPAGMGSLSTRCPARADCGGTTGVSCYGPTGRIALATARGAAAALLVAPHRSGFAAAPILFAGLGSTPAIPALWLHRDLLDALLPDAAGWEAAIDAGTPSPHDTSVTASVSVAGSETQTSIPNVIAVVPGSDPELAGQVVVIGAHFDHLGQLPFRATYYPGADDNASGTAVTLELARAVAASPTGPKRTLVFAFWNAEELGVLGSWYYTDAAPGGPLYPLAATVAALSVDMVGLGTDYLGLYDAGVPISDLAAVGAASAQELDIPGAVVDGGRVNGSDHLPFAQHGVLAALAMTGADLAVHPWYHTPEDRADTLSATDLGAAAQLVWATIRPWALGTESGYLTTTALRSAPPSVATSPVAPGFVVLE